MVEAFPFIRTLEVENFMSIKHAVLEFDESNILNLCGYNDSGKSAITRLFEIMLYDAYSTECVRYIHDGESYWRGTLTFADGMIYERMKSSDGSSVWELRRNGSVLYTNRLETGVSAIGGIPEAVSTYLGVAMDEVTGERLNVRRNSDKLFLVNTSGGDNYKILNTILKSEQLATASRLLNEDIKASEAEIRTSETRKDVLEEKAGAIRLPAEDVVAALRAAVAETKALDERLSILESLKQARSQVCSVSMEPILRMEIPEAVEYQALIALEGLRSSRDTIQGLNVSMVDIPEELDLSAALGMLKAKDVRKSLLDSSDELKEVTASLKLKQTSLNSLAIEGSLTLCPNCGTFIEGGHHIGC